MVLISSVVVCFLAMASYTANGDRVALLRSSGALNLARNLAQSGVVIKVLHIRAGNEVTDEVIKKVMVDRVGDAIGILGQIRVPSALFAAGSLTALYEGDIKQAAPRLKLAYVVLTALAFALHVAAVFCCTILSWRLRGADFDPVAESAAALLIRYFEYEYVAVGSFFFGGIFSFFLANTIRSFITFGNKREAHICSVINCLTSFFLLNFFDRAVVYYDSFGQYLVRFFQLSLRGINKVRFTWTMLGYLLLTVGSSTLVTLESAKHARQQPTTKELAQ